MKTRQTASPFSRPADRPFQSSARIAGIACAVLLAAGCASQPKLAASVEERAQARWDAILAQDLDTAYSLYSPGYRSATSRVDFEIALRAKRINWTSANVQESQCEGDACTVITNVKYRITAPVPGVPSWESERRIDERWVRTEGQWWYVPDL